MKKTIVYIRVSTVGQNEAGQRREIKRWLIGNNFDLDSVAWVVDKESGDKLDRPGFEKLNQAVFMGEVKSVVVWKLDRLSRNLLDGISTLAKWCEKGIRLISVTQQLDFSGPQGKLIAALLFGIAEMEQETRRERQRAGIEAARERGVYTGRKPGTTKSKPTRATKLLEQGLNHSEIAKSLGVSRRTVLRYMRCGIE